jgi:hypothetical protein
MGTTNLLPDVGMSVVQAARAASPLATPQAPGILSVAGAAGSEHVNAGADRFDPSGEKGLSPPWQKKSTLS